MSLKNNGSISIGSIGSFCYSIAKDIAILGSVIISVRFLINLRAQLNSYIYATITKKQIESAIANSSFNMEEKKHDIISTAKVLAEIIPEEGEQFLQTLENMIEPSRIDEALIKAYENEYISAYKQAYAQAIDNMPETQLQDYAQQQQLEIEADSNFEKAQTELNQASEEFKKQQDLLNAIMENAPFTNPTKIAELEEIRNSYNNAKASQAQTYLNYNTARIAVKKVQISSDAFLAEDINKDLKIKLDFCLNKVPKDIRKIQDAIFLKTAKTVPIWCVRQIIWQAKFINSMVKHLANKKLYHYMEKLEDAIAPFAITTAPYALIAGISFIVYKRAIEIIPRSMAEPAKYMLCNFKNKVAHSTVTVREAATRTFSNLQKFKS